MSQDGGTGAAGEPPKDAGGEKGWQELVRDVLGRVGISLLSLSALAGFVAAVGGAIVWTRFRAAELPADQALDKLPQGELIATGAVTVALYGVLGLIAAGGVYLIDAPSRNDDDDRRTRGLSRGLLLLVAVEAMVVSALLIKQKGWERFAVSVEIVILVLLLALAITRAPTRWAKLGKPYPDQRHVGAWAALKGFLSRLLLPSSCKQRKEAVAAQEAPAATGGNREPCPPLEALGFGMWRFALLLGAGAVALVAAALVADSGDRLLDAPLRPFGWSWTTPALGGLGLLILVPGVAFGLRWLEEDTQDRAAPASLYLTREGAVVLIMLAIAVIAAPALVLWEWWLAVALAIAVLLAGAAWLAASRARRHTFAYAVVVFASVPFLGAVAGIVRNAADPQVQPLALLHANGDRPPQAIQGIYVAETDDAVHFASVATDQCSGRVVDDSGRMLSVPRDEVLTMALGPRQSVGAAGKGAFEMAQALKLAIADPPAAPKREVIGATSTGDGDPDDRESLPAERGLVAAAGPALRREFSPDQSLRPRRAYVGDEIALRGERLGDEPDGRTVRIGGQLAPLARSRAARGVLEATGESPKDWPPPLLDVIVPRRELVRIARRAAWTDSEVRFLVPEDTETGAVTLECPPLGGQLNLEIRHRPHASFTLRPKRDSRAVVLDGRASSDEGEGEIVSHRWTVNDGRRRGGARAAIAVDPPPDGSRIELLVTDDHGDEAVARATMWRLLLPGGLIDDRQEEALEALRTALAKDRKLRLVAFAHAAVPDDSALDPDAISAQAAAQLQADLFPDASPQNIIRRRPRTFGDRCLEGLRAGQSQAVAQLDVYVLESGIKVGSPAGCTARRRG